MAVRRETKKNDKSTIGFTFAGTITVKFPACGQTDRPTWQPIGACHDFLKAT